MIEVLHQYNLKDYNTFGIEVYAKNFVEINTSEELKYIINNLKNQYQNLFILGGGSNILLTKDIDALVIKNNIKGIDIIDENDNEIFLRVYSGTIWHDLVTYAVDSNYQGIENLALIPGTVGAAPMQNIGAYGMEVKNIIIDVHAINLETGEELVFNHDACKFGYRESIFKHEVKNKYFIYAIDIQLYKNNYTLNIDYGDIKKVLLAHNIQKPTIKNVYDAVVEIRQSKLPDPKVLGNAGSFFKNPEISEVEFNRLSVGFPNIPNYKISDNKYKIPAAWLIEQCGLKGKIFGQTGNHAKQALVIVNYGAATGNEILDHAKFVIETVKGKFNILLIPEVNVY